MWDTNQPDPNYPVAYATRHRRRRSLDSGHHIDIPRVPGTPTWNNGCDNTNTQGMHTGQNILMGDGSVKLVTGRVSEVTWNAAITPNAKDVVGSDLYQ